jgi:hypothetical protein
MKMYFLLFTFAACCIQTIAGGVAVAADAGSIDWSKIPQESIALFYPGQSSYEWVRSEQGEAT